MTEFRLPWDDLAPPKPRQPKVAPEAAAKAPPPPAPDADPPPAPDAKRRPPVRRKATAPTAADAGGVAWCWWHLVVHGPEPEVVAFADAARGPGVIPWPLETARLEEEVLALALGEGAPSLPLPSLRTLARQFRDAVELRHARGVGQAGRGCPFDLHRLLPVPRAVLQLGAGHPEADAWLRRHWGVIDQPRRAAVLEGRTAGKRLPRGHGVQVVGFFTEGPAPEPARAALQARWPGLTLRLEQGPT